MKLPMLMKAGIVIAAPAAIVVLACAIVAALLPYPQEMTAMRGMVISAAVMVFGFLVFVAGFCEEMLKR